MVKFDGTGSPSPSRWLPRLALVAVGAVAASACGTTSHSSSPSATSNANGVKTVNVTLANESGKDGCKLDMTSAPAGPVTFIVTNSSAPGISEMELLKDQRIIGEKENLAPGLNPVSFTATLDRGAYQVYCPGAATEYQDFTVTGQAPPAPTGTVPSIVARGTKDYAAYVVSQVNQLNDAVKALDAAIQSGNMEAAKTAYAKARAYYEHAESSVEGFVIPGFAADDNAGTSTT